MGGGKTTLFNLLYGYYSPSCGTIRINGQDITQVSLKSLQGRISLLGQKPNLFKGSIRANICYGATHPEDVTDDEILRLSQGADLHEFLQSFPEKLETDVGEEGNTLSGGQQQKVAVLRGLLKNSPIRLLDEITASFDSQSATQLLQSILRTSEKITTLMITHKLTEAKLADLIIVLEKGKVIAQGPHAVLVESCPLYQELWNAYMAENSQNLAPSPVAREE
jgi:ABC-type multidrug transport system fused ATPase/permease subunit